jgi:hypothetical protein
MELGLRLSHRREWANDWSVDEYGHWQRFIVRRMKAELRSSS